MVSYMDDVIKDLIDNLKLNGLYEDSIIIFVSDNGGALEEGAASNFPLRNGKFSVYEGGIRTPGFIHAPKYIPKSG